MSFTIAVGAAVPRQAGPRKLSSELADIPAVTRNPSVCHRVVFYDQAEAIMTHPDAKAVEEDERLQADPELELSAGRARTGQIVIATIAAVAIVVLTLYGVTHQRDDTQQTAGTPAAQTTGAAPPANQRETNKQQANPPSGQQQAGQGNQPAAQQQGGSQPQGNRQADQGRPSGGNANVPRETTGAAPTESARPGAAQPAPSANQGGQQNK